VQDTTSQAKALLVTLWQLWSGCRFALSLLCNNQLKRQCCSLLHAAPMLLYSSALLQQQQQDSKLLGQDSRQGSFQSC
jgi:hypothetical protein